MKAKMIAAAAAAMLLAACSPQTYSIYLDVRQPSASGMDLSRKSMAIVYMDGPTKPDSLLGASSAASFAEAMEKDYFNGEEAIGMYAYPSADTVTVETMRRLIMDTGEDVVFLLRSRMEEPTEVVNKPNQKATHPDSAYVCRAKVPLKVNLYVYDSMGKDTVKTFNGSTAANVAVYNSGITPEENMVDLLKARVPVIAGEAVGSRISNRFIGGWATETFTFYWFEDLYESEWIEPIMEAQEGKFAEAVRDFAPFLKRGNYKAAHACYNIAMCFYLMGDLDLASRWLDEADKLENVSRTGALRRRIINKLQK